MDPDDPTYREYGEIKNVMAVIEELKSNLTRPQDMKTETRKSIHRNTRGPNPIYRKDALPARTMMFMRNGFREIGNGPYGKRMPGVTGETTFKVNDKDTYNLQKQN